MKRFLILCALLAAASSVAFAQTTVYNYRSNTYIDFESAFPPSDTPDDSVLPSLLPFTNAMRLQGSITVNQPFPPNLELVPIGPETLYPIEWSFNTGLDTYNNANQAIQVAAVSTDAEGNITQFGFIAVSPKPPFEDNQAIDQLLLVYGIEEFFGADQAIEGIVIKAGICTNPSEGQCGLSSLDESTAAAVIPAQGVWSRSTPSLAPVPVPGLGGLGLLALGSLMAGVVARRSHAAKKGLAAH